MSSQKAYFSHVTSLHHRLMLVAGNVDCNNQLVPLLISCSFHIMFFITWLLNFVIIIFMLIFGNRLQLWQCSNGATSWRRNPYTSAHVLIENILAQPRTRAWRWVAKIECLKALHSSASISVRSASVTVLGLLKKKKELVVFAVFRLATPYLPTHSTDCSYIYKESRYAHETHFRI